MPKNLSRNCLRFSLLIGFALNLMANGKIIQTSRTITFLRKLILALSQNKKKAIEKQNE